MIVVNSFFGYNPIAFFSFCINFQAQFGLRPDDRNLGCGFSLCLPFFTPELSIQKTPFCRTTA